MIFASDLDRTLIYSKKFISNGKGIKLIEKKEDEEISFMTEKAMKELKKLRKELLFIPVTTRTIEQYERITLFQEAAPEYAIVSNGGNILVDGEIDIDWNDFIQKKIKKECLPFEDLIKKFKEIASKEWVIKRRTADDLFTYCIINKKKMPMEKIYRFMDWLKDQNWKVSLQGRKLYFVPSCVCKWRALEHIKEQENIDFIVSAGDSLLDLPMLKKADIAIAPSHGEIYKNHKDDEEVENIIFTKREGIFAAEEILEKINTYAKKVG